jgi:hypothetical protein
MLIRLQMRNNQKHAVAFLKTLPTDYDGKVGFMQFREFVLSESDRPNSRHLL